MRALSFRSPTGAKALVRTANGWDIRLLRLDTETQEATYQTLGVNLFVLLDADPLGTMLRIEGQHGAFAVEGSAEETAMQVAQGNAELGRSLEDRANRIWVEDADTSLVFSARSRQR